MCSLFWQEFVVGHEALDVHVRIVVAVLGLCGVGGEQHARLGRTVDVLGEYGVLDLQEEHAQRDVLNDLVARVLRKVLGAELEEQRRLFGYVLAEHFLVELEPREQAFGVLVLQAEVPDLAQADRLHHLFICVFIVVGFVDALRTSFV